MDFIFTMCQAGFGTLWWSKRSTMKWHNRAFVLKWVKKSRGDLHYASEELKKDREIILGAVKNKGYALKFASKDFFPPEIGN